MKKKNQPGPVTITNCSIANNAAAANEHTRAACVALADAAKANAEAIGRIADALQRSGAASMDAGIRIDQGSRS